MLTIRNSQLQQMASATHARLRQKAQDQVRAKMGPDFPTDLHVQRVLAIAPEFGFSTETQIVQLALVTAERHGGLAEHPPLPPDALKVLYSKAHTPAEKLTALTANVEEEEEAESPDEPPVGSVVQPCPRMTDATHWIEIELLDESGTPVADEPYWLRLPDGSVREGVLDSNGQARYDGIVAGNALVSFRRLDGLVWNETPAADGEDATRSPAPPAAAGRARSWIAVDVLAENGDPVAGERYALTLPDGTVQKGVLDEDGSVLLTDIDPGTCQFTLPDLDGTLWEAVLHG